MIDSSLKSFLSMLSFAVIVLDIYGKFTYTGYTRTYYLDIQSAFEYPGTKWCGPGNSAENHDDLGEDRDADHCCRDHDDCPEYIEGDHRKYGLTNDAFYTRLACSCDQKFYKFLKDSVAKDSSSISFKVGYAYFDLLGTQCYAKDHPVVHCNRILHVARAVYHVINILQFRGSGKIHHLPGAEI